MSIVMENGRVLIGTTTAVQAFRNLKPGTLKDALSKAIPGIQWDGANKVWWVTAQEDHVNNVNKLFKTKFVSPAANIRSHISAFPFKTKPREVQLKALEVDGGREAFACFMEPGLGKTKYAIDCMQILNRDGKVFDVIVACPKSITGTWLREIGTHGHYDQWEIYRWNNDGHKPFVEKVHGPESGEITMRWFITNIDSFSDDERVAWKAAYQFVMRSIQCAIIIDESTTIKNIEAKRTLNALILGSSCKYRRILTGTPIANTPLDLYAQLTFLDPNIFYGWSYAAFRGHFAITGGYKQREIYGYTNQDELAAVVGEHSFRATKAEWLDLPPRIYEIREITLSKETWKKYDAIVNNVMAELSMEKTISVDMVTKKLIKLRQLVGGWVLEDKDPESKAPRVAHQMATEKLNDFKEFMEECRAVKVLVWCQFTHEVLNLYSILTEMGFKTVKYHGQMKTKERDQAEREFELGDAQVMVLQNDTGSMGLTLNAASVAYMYSNPSYLLPRNQLEDRNYRDGQTKSVTFVDSIAMGTLDQTNYDALMSKKDIEQLIMEASATKNLDALKGILYPKRTSGGWKADKRDA